MGSDGFDSDRVVRRKASVSEVEAVRKPGVVASCSAFGSASSIRWCTPVLVRIMPTTSWRLSSAQPVEISPPQSWPTVTTGPCSDSASVSRERSVMRSW